jgi:hypothetical protein
MYRFETSLIKSYNGREQVQAYQTKALLSLKYTFKFYLNKAESIIASLYKTDLFIIPIWTQAVFTNSVIPSGTDTIPFTIGRRDFSTATHLFITNADIYSPNETSYSKWQCSKIVSVGEDKVTIEDDTVRSYTNAIIIPAFEAYLTAEPRSYDYPELGLIDMTLDFTLKNRLNLSTIYDYARTTFNGRMVFNFPNYFSDNTSTTSYVTEFETIDLKAGMARTYRKNLTPPIIRQWGFFARDYESGRKMLELIYMLAGNQTLFYAPTYKNEFRMVEGTYHGEYYIKVFKSDFDAISDNMMNSRAVYFKTPEGSFIKEIDHIMDATDFQFIYFTTELDYDVPLNKCHICWLILSRVDSSYTQIHQENFSDISCSINTVEVRDE